jgi:hypothetical protein
VQESKYSVGIVRVLEWEEEWEWAARVAVEEGRGQEREKNLVEWTKMARNLRKAARDLGKEGGRGRGRGRQDGIKTAAAQHREPKRTLTSIVENWAWTGRTK